MDSMKKDGWGSNEVEEVVERGNPYQKMTAAKNETWNNNILVNEYC